MRRLDIAELADAYNSILLFEHRQPTPSPPTFQQLAEIFMRQNAHHNFGVCLLHRHRRIESDQVMVHTRDGNDTDICKPEQIGHRRLQPTAFFSPARGRMQAFEFDSREVAGDGSLHAIPDLDFLNEVGAFLWESGLSSSLGVVRLEPLDLPWVEGLLAGGVGTIARRSDHELVEDNDGIATEWAFIEDQGRTRVRPLRACKESQSGGHVRSAD